MKQRMIRLSALCIAAGISLPYGALYAAAEENDSAIGFAQCGEYINIRSGADTESDVVGKIYNNGIMEILEETEDGWYRIHSGNVDGYIRSDYVATGAEAKALAETVGYTTAEVGAWSLHIRSAMSSDSESIGEATEGQELEVVADYGDWVKVVTDEGTYGYVAADYVYTSTEYRQAETLEEEQARLDAQWLRYLETQNSDEEAASEETSYDEETEAYVEPTYTEETEAYVESTYTEETEAYVEPTYTEETEAYVEPTYTEETEAYVEPTYTEETEAYVEPTYTEETEAYVEPTYTEETEAYVEPSYTEETEAYVEPSYTEETEAYVEPSYTEETEAYVEPTYTEETEAYVEPSYTEETEAYVEPTYTEETEAYVEPTYTEETEAYQEETQAETSSSSSSTGQAIADYAAQFVGNPYVYGGSSLTSGADCSGFVMSVFANFGISLPHYSGSQMGYGYAVDASSLQAGDLVFYGDGGSQHVAIYIGGGSIVHAANSSVGIVITDMYWPGTPTGYRRLV